MTQWYYVDAQQQRHGPVDPRVVGDLFRDGTLGRTSLVWREGMQEWTALINVAPELRLDMTPPPPPVPDAIEAPAAATLETERPLTGRAVFTASEPTYLSADTVVRPEPTLATGHSPYAAPRADIGAHAYAAAVHEGHVVYAGFWKRVAASLIDGFAIGLPVAIIVAIVGGLLGWGSSFSGDLMASNQFNPGETVLSWVLSALVFAWFHSSAGLLATPGKLAIGIKVVRADGEKISFLRGFGRYWAYLLSAMLLCIGLLMAAFTGRKQGLHDFMCDTLVVDKWAFTSQPERQRDELGTVTVVVLVVGGLMVAGVLVLAVLAGFALASMGR
ncbi:RDD family protein [Pseudoxanthomonas sp. LjRoot143]|uniref:RDD family protein n=1 Tax=Pseudoxanthomonas sp. LjRoot143 TaxID=3342266 RepID=UPI003ECD75E8